MGTDGRRRPLRGLGSQSDHSSSRAEDLITDITRLEVTLSRAIEMPVLMSRQEKMRVFARLSDIEKIMLKYKKALKHSPLRD